MPSSSLLIVVAITISSINRDFFTLSIMYSNIEIPLTASISTLPGNLFDVILASIDATIFLSCIIKY